MTVAAEPLSRYLSDDDLRRVLEGCAAGEVEYWRTHPVYTGYAISSWGSVYSRRSRRIIKPELHDSGGTAYLPGRYARP